MPSIDLSMPEAIHEVAFETYAAWSEGGQVFSDKAIEQLSARLLGLSANLQELWHAVASLGALALSLEAEGDAKAARAVQDLVARQAPHFRPILEELESEASEEQKQSAAAFSQMFGGGTARSAPRHDEAAPEGSVSLKSLLPNPALGPKGPKGASGPRGPGAPEPRRPGGPPLGPTRPAAAGGVRPWPGDGRPAGPGPSPAKGRGSGAAPPPPEETRGGTAPAAGPGGPPAPPKSSRAATAPAAGPGGPPAPPKETPAGRAPAAGPGGPSAPPPKATPAGRAPAAGPGGPPAPPKGTRAATPPAAGPGGAGGGSGESPRSGVGRRAPSPRSPSGRDQPLPPGRARRGRIDLTGPSGPRGPRRPGR